MNEVYTKEEVIKMLMQEEKYLRHSAEDVVSNMKPTFLPTLESTSSDRDRVRMELWK